MKAKNFAVTGLCFSIAAVVCIGLFSWFTESVVQIIILCLLIVSLILGFIFSFISLLMKKTRDKSSLIIGGIGVTISVIYTISLVFLLTFFGMFIAVFTWVISQIS